MDHLLQSSFSAQSNSITTNSSPFLLNRHFRSRSNSTPTSLAFASKIHVPKLDIVHRTRSYTTCRLKLGHNSSPTSPDGSRNTPPQNSGGDKKLAIMVCSIVTIALAIANRVLYKLALVPMKEYPFFLAQLTTFGYLLLFRCLLLLD